MKQPYDAIVVGAGIVGISTALHLQQRGQSVLLLDKTGATAETSYGNSGIIESSYVLPFAPPPLSDLLEIALNQNAYARIAYPSGIKQLPWILNFYINSQKHRRVESGRNMRPLIQHAIKDHQDLLSGTNGLKYLNDQGRAKIHRTQKSFENAQFERDIIAHYGIPFETHTAKAFKEIEPDIAPIFHAATTLSDSKRYTNPAKAFQSLADKFTGQGDDFKIECVKTLTQSLIPDHWTLSTDQNTYSAKNIIICTGPWANDLIKQLGHKFPIGMKRGYHQHFKSPAKVSHAIVDADEGYLIAPMEQGIRLTTGAEFSDKNAPANPIQIQKILPKAKQLIEISEAAEHHAWLGTRPCTADSLPIIGQSNKHKGLWFNIGHGHCGVTAGPSSAKLLAQIITNEKPFCPPQAFSPNRFNGSCLLKI